MRVFWVPGGLPTRSKVVALLSGRDTYRPPELLQRRILKKDPARARVVAGEPAKVSELRQQWSDTTVAENPRDFARFVIRRAILAIERVEFRLLGPEYKSPRLVKPEMLASTRFRDGLEKIPGATVEKAGEMLDELATGWSRFSVDLIPGIGRAIFSRGFDPNSTTTEPRSSPCGTRWNPIRRCCCSRTGPTSTVRSCRWRCRRTGCHPCTRSLASTCHSA